MSFQHRATSILLLVVLYFATAPVGAGQSPAPAAPAGAPAAAGQRGRGGAPPIKSPEVASDGRVTFRLRAASAKEVVVNMAGKRLPLERNDQGVWTVTTEALAPDYY